MTSPFLRRFRIFIAALVFILTLLTFIDFRYLIPVKFINGVLFLQFVPSLLKFINLKTLAASGFIVVIVLTLLTGRTYCSFLCPLGIGQDINSRLGGRIKRKFRRFGFKKPHTIIRYGLLAITLIVTFIWGIYMVSLLDPYSIFGRFVTYFIKPLVLLLNNFVEKFLSGLIYLHLAIFVLRIPFNDVRDSCSFSFLIGLFSNKGKALLQYDMSGRHLAWTFVKNQPSENKI